MTTFPKVTIEFIPDPDMGGFTAHIPDIPAYGEGATEEEAIADLKMGLELFIEENGLEVTLQRINAPSHIRQVDLGDLVTHG